MPSSTRTAVVVDEGCCWRKLHVPGQYYFEHDCDALPLSKVCPCHAGEVCAECGILWIECPHPSSRVIEARQATFDDF